MLNDLKELIAIKSTLGDKGENAPFGEGPRAALDWFLKKAESYGLKTGELGGYCGWAEYGEGDECIAALCHLDVVPAGEGWAQEPFSLLIEDGRLYGRGVADDKGAAIMCLHALKEIKESGYKPSKRIRLIVGLNEEHGSECIKYYCKHGEIPKMSFVPDSEFPIINSEKGILHLGVRTPLDKFLAKNIAHIAGGQSLNVIPAKASVSIFKDSPLGRRLIELCGGEANNSLFEKAELTGGILASGASLNQFSVKNEEKVITITAEGRAGHALAPKKADNAIWKIFTVLELLSDSQSKFTSLLNEYFFTHLCCEKLGVYKDDEQSGDTTMSIGIIECDDNSLYFTIDTRLPLSLKADEVKKSVQAVLSQSKIETLGYSPNLFINPESDLVKTLLEVYSQVSGQKGHCIKSGGGTYARQLPNAIAFGPVFPDREPNLHKADENLSVEDFFKAAAIYKEAFIRLSK